MPEEGIGCVLVAAEVGYFANLAVLDPKDKVPENVKLGSSCCAVSAMVVHHVLIIAAQKQHISFELSLCKLLKEGKHLVQTLLWPG